MIRQIVKKSNLPGQFHPGPKQANFPQTNFYKYVGHKQAKKGGTEVKKWPA